MSDLKQEWEYIKNTEYISIKRLKKDLVKNRVNRIKLEYIKYILICLLILKPISIKSFFNFINHYEDNKVKDWECIRDNFLKQCKIEDLN